MLELYVVFIKKIPLSLHAGVFMNKELSFKVILSAIHPNALEAKDAIASLLASSFNVPLQQAISLFAKLPVILFDNLSTNDVKAIKDHLLFFSKLGLDFNVTPKPMEGIARANWAPKVSIPIVTCPSCGEMFYLMRCQDVQQHLSAPSAAAVLPPIPATASATTQAAPTKPVPASKAAPSLEAKPPISKPSGVAGTAKPAPSGKATPTTSSAKSANAEDLPEELVDINVLSSELRSIVELEEKPQQPEVEEIEEVGSISEEMQQMETEEPRKAIPTNAPQVATGSAKASPPQLSPALAAKAPPKPPPPNLMAKPPISSKPSHIAKVPPGAKPSGGNKPPLSKGKATPDMEEIGGISAEFEEIEGVSAEFERICLEGMEENIGSLSAEFEEIDGGLSSEFDGVKPDTKIVENVQPKKIANKPAPPEDMAHIPEMEDMQEISSEFANMADSASPASSSKQSLQATKSHDREGRFKSDTSETNPTALKMPSLGAIDAKSISRTEDTGATAKPDAKAAHPKTVGMKSVGPGKADDFKLEPGNAKVFVTFHSKGDREAAAQLISRLKGIPLPEAKALTESLTPVTLFTNLSLPSAQYVRKQLEAMQFQVRIGNA